MDFATTVQPISRLNVSNAAKEYRPYAQSTLNMGVAMIKNVEKTIYETCYPIVSNVNAKKMKKSNAKNFHTSSV